VENYQEILTGKTDQLIIRLLGTFRKLMTTFYRKPFQF